MADYLISEFALAVLLGAVFQEVIHWYNLRSRLHLKSMQSLIRSKGYWITTLAMIVITVFGVYFWFNGIFSDQSFRDLFIFGAGFPLIFKSVVKSVTGNSSVNLGTESENPTERDEPNLRAYFGV